MSGLLLLFFTASGSQPSGKSSMGRKRAVRWKAATGPALRRLSPTWLIGEGVFLVVNREIIWSPDTTFHTLPVNPYWELSMGGSFLSWAEPTNVFGRVSSPLLAGKHPSWGPTMLWVQRGHQWTPMCKPGLGTCTEHCAVRASHPRLGHGSEIMFYHHLWRPFVFPHPLECMLLLPNPPLHHVICGSASSSLASSPLPWVVQRWLLLLAGCAGVT